jgi:hypothetical protein
MAKYRKKPVVIDAIQWTGQNTYDVFQFCKDLPVVVETNHGTEFGWLIIPTLEGKHYARPSDWIIKGVKGEFYPCKPDIFEATYDPA